MGLLRLLASDQTTVLFDFDDPTGAANPSAVKTNLAAGLDMGHISPVLQTFPNQRQGAALVDWKHEPVEMTIPFMASAATDDALWAGLGQLARYLTVVSWDAPAIIEWTDLSTVRYLDIIGALNLPELLRGQPLAGLVATRKSSLGPMEVRLLRQPWKRGPDVTTTGVSVPMDPATSTKVRVYPINVQGDLPTPAQVKVTMDSGSAVQRVMIASRPVTTTTAADYLSDTGVVQAEATNRGWTVTLGTDTSGATLSSGSPGSGTSVARTTFNTNANMVRRWRGERTSKMDSLRGAWDVIGRFHATGAGRFVPQLRWGPSTADPVAFTNDEVTHDTAHNGTPGTFGWVELDLGRIYFPTTGTLSGAALEVWVRRESGSGSLDLDYVWLVPADRRGVVRIEGGSAETWLGSKLSTPPAQITGDPAWVAGEILSTAVRFNAVNEGAGTPPNTGIVWGTGRHTFAFTFTKLNANLTYECRVVNITDNTETVVATVSQGGKWPVDKTLTFDGVAGKAYQAQVVVTSYTNGSLTLTKIAHTFTAALASGESVRTDPATRYAVDRLDGGGAIAGYLGVEGEVPTVLDPGDSHLMIQVLDIPLSLYDENESVRTRTPTVSVTYQPRYA